MSRTVETDWESWTNAELRVAIETSENSAATARGTRDVSQADARARYARQAEQARSELARRHELPDGHDIRVGPGTIQVLARASINEGWHWFEVASNEEACHALELHAYAAANGEDDGIVELPDGHDIRVEPNSIEVQVRGSRGIDIKMRGKWIDVATDIDACEILSYLAREAKEEGRATEGEASGDRLADGAVGAAVGGLLLGPVGLLLGAAAGAMLSGGEAERSAAKMRVEDPLASLEDAFLGSDFFPLRIGDRIDATRDGVVVASVRLRDGDIVVKPMGEGKKAAANANRVAQLFVSRGGRPRPPARASGRGGERTDADAVTYTVIDNGKVLARGLPAEDVADAMRRAKPRGDATVIDERDGTVVISGTDGNEVTLARVETLLEKHESNHVVAPDAQPFAPAGAARTYRCWVVTKRKPREVKVWYVPLKKDAIYEVTAAVREHESEGGVESHDPRKPYETTWAWVRGKLVKTEF